MTYAVHVRRLDGKKGRLVVKGAFDHTHALTTVRMNSNIIRVAMCIVKS